MLGTAFGLLLLGSGHLHAAGLSLEGKLILRNGNLDGARVVLVSSDETKVLDRGLDHFQLDLKLHRSYLIAFERPGFISKQLLFNTGVPAGSEAAYTFPFQVTLDPLPQGQPVEYAGPVGYIHFDPQVNGFGYSTDYRIAKDDVLDGRLRAVASTLATAGATPTSAAGTLGGTMRNPYAQLAPTLSKVAPVVHVLAPSPDQPQSTQRGLVPEEWMESVAKRSGNSGLMARADGQSTDAADGAGNGMRWSREVKVEPLRVITIVKLEQGGREVEYRRVASYYGGVTYFQDGRPCTADTYTRATGR